MNKSFIYGASMYPEVQDREVWARQMDEMKAAGLNVLRLADAAWGHLEPQPDQYDFDWLRDYLDLAAEKGFRVILGTGSFIAPLWLSGDDPSVLVSTAAKGPVHPHSRKACCINGETYRSRVRSFLTAYIPAFKDHPAVMAWQIDNEIDSVPMQSCHCAHCEAAWTRWLRETFQTPDQLNEALALQHWGMRIMAFEHLPMPRHCLEAPTYPHALHLQFRKFERDCIFGFLDLQAEVMRACGATQPFLHDWMMNAPSPQNDPRNRGLFDLAGLNVYPQPGYGADAWDRFWLLQDMARSHGQGEWLCVETITTACGSNELGESPTPEQFRVWMLQMVAFGAIGMIYWSGNRLRGGHWPYWGGLFGWTEQPEPELAGQVAALGRELKDTLIPALNAPVTARAAILYDYDQAWATRVYPHTPAARMLVESAAQSLRRIGLGVNMVPAIDFDDAAALAAYDLIVLSGCPTFESDRAVDNLEQWVRAGGTLLVTPLVAYQTPHGVFRQDGLGGAIRRLIGCFGTSVRKVPVADAAQVKIGGLGEGATDAAPICGSKLEVRWDDGQRSEPGLDGWCELLEVDEDADVMARYSGDHAVLGRRAAVVRRHLGDGSVWKLGYWPREADLVPEILASLGFRHAFLSRPLPAAVTAVPRADGSLWIINPLNRQHDILLCEGLTDRLSKEALRPEYRLRPFEALWLENNTAVVSSSIKE